MNRSGLRADRDFTVSSEHVVDLTHVRLLNRTDRAARRYQKLIDIRPSGKKHTRLEHATVLNGAGPAIHMIHRFQQRSIEMHADELGNGFKKNACTRSAEIEAVVGLGKANV